MIAKTSFAGITRVAAAITCASSGFPPTSCNPLGSCDFSRVPLPAAMMAIAIRGVPVGVAKRADEPCVENFLPEEEVGLDFFIRPNIPCGGSRQKSELADDRFDCGRLKSSA